MKKEEENKPNNNRRDFIKTSAIAAAGFMIVPRHVLGRGFVAPSDRLVVARIGVGWKRTIGYCNVSQKWKSEYWFLM